jgi:hypothetical protein
MKPKKIAGLLRRLRTIDRQLAFALVCLTDESHRIGDYDDAIRALKRARRSVPDDCGWPPITRP